MNRPFYAFGALLLGLALAMLAVSSTSRSTTVRPNGPSPAHGRAERPTATPAVAGRARRPGGIYIIVLPEALGESSATAGGEYVATPCYAAGCGLDRLTGRVYPPVGSEWTHWECESVCPVYASWAPTISTATISLAADDPALFPEEVRCDCRSHYDAAYDRIVYGEPGKDGLPIRPTLGNLRTILLGVRNRVVREIERFSWTASWQQWLAAATRQTASSRPNKIDWSDYAALLNETEAPGALDSATAESSSPVRSGRWVLHFAASSLNRASDVLDAVAGELHRAAKYSDEPQLAGEHQPSQR